jgi:transmembrane sensor
MDDGPESAEAKASREASTWLILLQEEPEDAGLRQRFEDWLAESPVNLRAWTAIRHVSAVARALQSDGADGRQSPSDGVVRTVRPGRRWAAAGALAAVAACLALVFGPQLVLHLEADYVTSTAEQRTVALQDGSEVMLAAGSAIAVSYDAEARRIRLLAGEAFFDVAPDPRHPFRVSAADVETSVLGTRFGVRLSAQGVTVAVAEGTVEVGLASPEASPGASPGAAPVERLVAGQAARVSGDGRIARTSMPPQLVASWRRGQLYLHDQTMRDAVDQLRRYYAGTIILADDSLAERRVTGVYNLSDPEDALLGLVRAHGAKMRRITPWLIVLSNS